MGKYQKKKNMRKLLVLLLCFLLFLGEVAARGWKNNNYGGKKYGNNNPTNRWGGKRKGNTNNPNLLQTTSKLSSAGSDHNCKVFLNGNCEGNPTYSFACPFNQCFQPKEIPIPLNLQVKQDSSDSGIEVS